MRSGIELRHLRYFLAVVEAQNFTRAAARLGVTQPSVSQQLKDLENRLGTALFSRLGKEARLTDAGSAFRVHAERVLRQLDEAFDSVGTVAELRHGRIEVGVVPALNHAWIPPVIARLAQRHPGLVVLVHERPTRAVERGVEQGEFEIGVGLQSRPTPRVHAELLREEPLALVLPEEHALAHRRTIEARDLAELELVLLPESYDLRRAIDAAFASARLRPRIVGELDAVDAILRTVALTGRPTILPRVVLEGRPPLGLVAVPFGAKAPRVSFGVFTRTEPAPSPAAAAFLAALRAHVGSPPDRKRHAAR